MTHIPFEIDSACEDETGRLRLSGELDLATVARVQEAVDGLFEVSGAEESLPFIEDPAPA
jgi:hypothetical protein